MSSSSRPSIFTSRESFQRQNTLAPRTNGVYRRQSTPEALEKNRIQAAAARASLRIALPENEPALGRNTFIHRGATTSPTIWASFSGGEGSKSKGRSSSASQAAIPPSSADLTQPSLEYSDRKRPIASPSSPYGARGFASEPSRKRPKLRQRSKHYLSTFPLDPSVVPPNFEPPSPLFFSNSPQPRPRLPPRFSSSEAAARMLSKARSEDSHVKTVSLTRGLVTTPNLPTSAPVQHNLPTRNSMDRNSSGRSNSPEVVQGMRDVGNMLNSIGVIELLEQDERPTFIIDLGDSSNYGPGQLQLVFSNPALRSYHGLEALVSGPISEALSPGAQTFLQFKSWLLSAAIQGESLNVCLPSLVYSGISWSCSTLRKRLRIISGAFIASPASSRSPGLRMGIPQSSSGLQSLNEVISAPAAPQEASDYFGTAEVPSAKLVEWNSDGSSSTATSALPTIEDPLPPVNNISSDTTLTPLENASPMDLQYSHISDAVSTAKALTASPYDIPSFDWTRIPLTDSLPDHIRFARSVDWAATSLGPIEHWDTDLRQMCNLIMSSPHPAAMYWGDDLIAIYNEAYILLAGQKHPTLMGQSYRVAWAEIWDDVKDVFASARATGEATMKDDDCLFLKRSDYLEETYFSWSIIPMLGNDGSVMGLYNPAFEKTRRKIAERRMLTLREVGERTASARDVKAFWAQVLGSFELNEYDSPFLLLYSVSEDSDSDTSSIHSNSLLASRQCSLEGSLGVPEDHQAAPPQIDLKNGVEGFGPVFREAMKADRPVMLEIGSQELPQSLVEGLDWRGFGDPVRYVVVCPIHPTTGESILGFLVLGVNPRRPYDDDYSLFVQLLSRQLATSLASVVLFEEEIRRGQRAAKLAALDRIELSEKLAERTKEAIESETKFTRMAEFAPVGMFIAGSDGRITFANDTWYEISRVPKNPALADTWMNSVHEDDVDAVKRLWHDLVNGGKPVSSEFRFKAQWEDRNGHRGDTWVLFSVYPETHVDGSLKSIFGSITNISQRKWAEGLQKRKMEEAVELKRQQENFIDITSHEMRNPLSAILQCSDEIANSLTKFRQSGGKDMSDELVTSCLDAAQIINLCSQHQKRIVDDILTLSKLDSQLLLVTPVDAQPLTVVQRALKMHEGELQNADIQMKFVVHQTYRDLALDWVRFDPSRVLQVLINLTTNAIKFTGSESRRTITVTIAACKERPSDRPDAPVKYFSTRKKGRDVIEEKEWGDGEKVYIHFSVKDTGRGLNPDEKKMLFLRFSQASPRTHVQYGGSGLGLFISRELTELQGGEIGVESEAGQGSTFAFYVVARRSTAPNDADTATGIRRPNPASDPKTSSPASLKKATLQLADAAHIPAPNNATTPPRKEKVAVATSGPKRVLIVEDNLVNQRVLQKQLKNIGMEVYVANHGGEALEKLKLSTYWSERGGAAIDLGVVLMDQEMPVMDGLTCTRKIRELEREGKLVGHVPIIAVTANARAEQVQTALDAGMDDVVSKPFRIPDLVPKIEELMLRHPAPREG